MALLLRFAPVASPAVETQVPFGVGERLDYELKFGFVKVGSGRVEMIEIDTTRGRQTWHASFAVKGGTFFYKVDDIDESWIDTETFASLRFLQRHQEGGGRRDHEFEIYPERSTFLEKSDPRSREEPSVAQPLDYASFLFFVRTIPLVVGKTYQFNRYFRPDGNPVTLTVVRRERITVPAGTFNAIVVHPVIRTRGLFSDRGQAEIWLADDSTRIMLQLKARLPVGSLGLQLKSYRAGASTSPGSASATAR
ncbi:MAG: DUF3108 domain-containing protein [Gemmatimonadota bacterium]|nr:DUF3108 domain-containing protein [Gemmatimonadota bacterium]